MDHAAHERLILANLATSLFEHGKITTTEAKARRVRPLAEKLITKAKRGDLHNRRQIQRVIRDKDVVHKLLAEIGPFFDDRPGGYVRITKTLPRKGDNAPMAVIELVSEKTVTAEAERARKSRFAKDEAKAEETPAAEVADQDAEAPASATKEATAEPAEGADEDTPQAEAKSEEAAEESADEGKKDES